MLAPQIVSPAGNLQKLKLATSYGADAVYAGLSVFSLRSRAAREFNAKTFAQGVEYAHSKGVKVYATVNGFHNSAALPGLERHFKELADFGVDAFIVASIGAMAMARRVAPEVALHVSTQANILNYADAKVYEDMGASRVVVARELGMQDIRAIKEQCPKLSIEAFVHGSMCFAYSGRCLISALQSNRKSNRGACANDCRFPYELYAKGENGTVFRLEQNEGGTHVFNSKDLNLASHIKDIMAQGLIDAFKIEGRTKSEYYVALATRTYKMAVKDAMEGVFDAKKYEKELSTLQNRGFTDAFLNAAPNEREDTQNHESSVLAGSASVEAFSENGFEFASKGLIKAKELYEVLLPLGQKPSEFEDECCEFFYQNEQPLLRFKKLVSSSGKGFLELHSGNTNLCTIKTPLPPLCFLRSFKEA